MPAAFALLLILVGMLALIAFVSGVILGRTGREQLRLELSNLRGKHETLSQAYIDLRRIAGEALEVAKQKHFPSKVISSEQHDQLESQFRFETVQPDYTPPEVKFCPKCSVSVRAEEWPQNCPNCGYLFGDVLDAGEIELPS